MNHLVEDMHYALHHQDNYDHKERSEEFLNAAYDVGGKVPVVEHHVGEFKKDASFPKGWKPAPKTKVRQNGQKLQRRPL